FLRSGIKGKTVLDLSRDLLLRFGSLTRILTATPEEFCLQDGLGLAKYVQLQAMLELSQRHLREQLEDRDVLTSSELTRQYLRARLSKYEHEVFACLYLDNQHRVVNLEELFSGTIDGAAVYPREVVKRCLHNNAAAVIFAHNHPSGVAEPSRADEMLTIALKSALALVDVKVLDHFIIAGADSLSFAERGLL
ncbi:MAG: DNA repair protein RadC, partial [Parvibaculum sp.]|nr:DNA repair protein RadC [Parvibaculum sp.]